MAALTRTLGAQCSVSLSADERLYKCHHPDVPGVHPSEKPEKGINLDDFAFLELTEKFVRASENGGEDIRKYLCNLLLVYKDYHREVEEPMHE